MNFNAQLEIDLNKLKNNIDKLKEAYNDYEFIIANIKNNAFGMGYNIIDSMVKNGVDYLFTSALEEALEIRKINAQVPILVNFEFDKEYIYDAIANNITITVCNLEYLVAINDMNLTDKLNIHILIDNGCNKLGFNDNDSFRRAIEIIDNNEHLHLEGLYTEFTTFGIIDEDYYQAFNNFYNLIKNVDKKDLIIHLNEPVMYHKKHNFINGIRFDLSLLGIEENINDNMLANFKIKTIEKKYNDLEFPNIDLTLIFSIKAGVMSLNKAKKGTLIGRNYIAVEDMNLAILPIGHKDGITKALKTVSIHGEECNIVADSIDYLIVEVPKETKIGDEVYLIEENMDVYNIIELLKTNRFYLMSIFNTSLKKVYVNECEGESIL